MFEVSQHHQKDNDKTNKIETQSQLDKNQLIQKRNKMKKST